MPNTPDLTPATREFVYKTVRKWAIGVAVGFALLTGGLGLALQQNASLAEGSRTALVASGKAGLVYGCNRDFVSSQSFRNLLDYLEGRNAASFKDGRIDLVARKESKAFYEFALREVTVPDCREAEAVLTDNPVVPIPVLKPLHEGN